MKKTLSIMLILCILATLLAGCGQNGGSQNQAQNDAKPAEDTEIIVFAAASMQETLTELKGVYEKANPGVKLTYTFDSSGTLKKQIQEGAECDVFISAGQKQMNQLDINADKSVNTEGLDFVAAGTRFNILENKVALVVPDNDPKNIKSIEDLIAHLKAADITFAMGDADVPVGQYTQKILAHYGLSEEELAKKGVITYGSNVKDVTSKVKEAAVDCGIVYKTDAFSAKLTVVDTATKDMCGQILYPAAVMKNSKHPEAAKAFLDFLKTKDAGAVFEAVGFTPLN